MSVSQTPILNYVVGGGGLPPVVPGSITIVAGSILVTQPGHGFVKGNVVYLNGTSDTYVLAQADTAANADAVGMVSEVVNADRFVLTTHGRVEGLSGFTAGTVYFLSDTTAGALTDTEPSIPGTVSKPLFIGESATAGIFFNWRGMTVPAPITSMTLNPLYIGTDLRISAVAGGGKVEARNTTTNTWATVAQWTNP